MSVDLEMLLGQEENMFSYFIQAKGFLDGDEKYLQNRLKMVKAKKGDDQFLTFYRYFLLTLFHEGFGKEKKDRERRRGRLECDC